MASSIESPSASGRHIALLIDAENASAAKLPAILAELSKYGTANIRRAYGDWTAAGLKSWRAQLHEYAIRPIQQFSYSKGKNASDIAMVIDALELLYTQNLAAFCIASSDADFTPLVMHLRAAGKDVYGFGERKTPEPFQNACTTFLFLETLAGAAAATGTEPAAPAKTATRRVAKPKVAAAAPEKSAKPLAQDSKLVTVLRGAVEASAGENGWARLSSAGSAAKRLAPIDPRNYGVSNFTKLFEATGLFEVVRGQNGQPYLADRAKEHAAGPDD
ncbi:NYN domain-containing protein [Novosphingobium sp.]|uniref:NYN domain-containing protein n=1 Tax=Novosphingobium sp. TaxID=1874826 RepID=UPI00286D601A|nr:NYN domain-containing protein [Novosphingobium sp.]